MGLGKDNITDMLSLTLEAKIKDFNNWQTDMEIAYLKLDKTLARIIKQDRQRQRLVCHHKHRLHKRRACRL